MPYDALNADQRSGTQLNGKSSLTIDQAALQLTREGRSWSSQLGEPAVVTYAYRATAPAQMPLDTVGFERFNDAEIYRTQDALARWSEMANIKFVQVGADISGRGYSDDATILFGNYTSGAEKATAFAFLPGDRSSTSQAGDVWVSAKDLLQYGTFFEVFLHEIGHALGLSHPSDYDADDAADVTYAKNARYVEDSREYSVMSYFDPEETGASVRTTLTSPGGPLIDDIAAVQRLYGANLSTNVANTTYGYNEGIGRGPDKPAPYLQSGSLGDSVWGAIWDAGGDDTLDFTQSRVSQKIDLHAGAFSNVDGSVGTLSIAQGVVIENARGGDFDDLLIGNDVANRIYGNAGRDSIYGNRGDDILDGGGGDDVLNGGGGNDTAMFSFSFDKFALSLEAGAVILSGPQGNDRLVSIERIRFLDRTFDAPDPDPLVADAWYYRANPDVAAAGVDADDHYAASGWREGRDPNAFFDTSAYFDANRDVAAARVNPLDHYIASGAREGRDPSALFDNEQYLARNPDVAAAGANPLLHYLGSGRAEGRATYAAVGSRLIVNFDPEYYLLTNPDVARAGADPLAHYLAFGAREGRDPNAYFDTRFYLEHNPDVAAVGANPLLHYERYGWHEGRDPSAAFDTSYYLAANPDVAAAGVDPMFHYLTNGRLEGRAIFGSTTSANMEGWLV